MIDKQQIWDYNGPIPPMPKMFAENGNEDFIANVQVLHRAIAAMLEGAPNDMFEWRTNRNVTIGTPYGYHTNELLKRNLRALERWESVQKAKRTAPPRPKAPNTDDNKRARALGILRKVESELSTLGVDTTRDDSTNREIYSLGRFVNDGVLTHGDIRDMIIRASCANGHYPHNKSLTQIESDIRRTLRDSARDGILPDWDNE